MFRSAWMGVLAAVAATPGYAFFVSEINANGTDGQPLVATGENRLGTNGFTYFHDLPGFLVNPGGIADHPDNDGTTVDVYFRHGASPVLVSQGLYDNPLATLTGSPTPFDTITIESLSINQSPFENGREDIDGSLFIMRLAVAAGTSVTGELSVLFNDGTGNTQRASADFADGASFGSVFDETISIRFDTSTLDVVENVVLGTNTVDLIDVYLVEGAVAEPCPGDANGDSVVNVADFIDVLLNFGATGETGGDATGDGVVNVADFIAVLLNFGETC